MELLAQWASSEADWSAELERASPNLLFAIINALVRVKLKDVHFRLHVRASQQPRLLLLQSGYFEQPIFQVLTIFITGYKNRDRVNENKSFYKTTHNFRRRGITAPHFVWRNRLSGTG